MTSHVITLTKKGGFAASHSYWNPEWDEAKNNAVFDLCSNRAGHGHNYKVEMSITGSTDPKTGMVVNLKDVKESMNLVLSELEHQNLNHQVPHFKQTIPTLENIALYLWEQLTVALASKLYKLTRLKVIEHDDLFIEYYGGAMSPEYSSVCQKADAS